MGMSAFGVEDDRISKADGDHRRSRTAAAGAVGGVAGVAAASPSLIRAHQKAMGEVKAERGAAADVRSLAVGHERLATEAGRRNFQTIAGLQGNKAKSLRDIAVHGDTAAAKHLGTARKLRLVGSKRAALGAGVGVLGAGIGSTFRGRKQPAN